MPLKCSPHIAPSGVPCIRPPKPLGPGRPWLPVMSVNGKQPNAGGDVEVIIPEVVPPSVEGAGKAADAKAVYEALKTKASNADLEAESDRAKEVERGLDERITELEDDEGGITELMFETTHADLVTLRDNGALIPGMQYRITDYVATTVQRHTQSANHPFDIIVTADSPDKLNEVARAIRHEGDTYFPKTTKFEAWKIWYSLDNDTNRFGWADEENGKGVIYRMIDEWNNDVPYDFKGILTKAYIDGSWGLDYQYTFGGSEDQTIKANSYCYSNKIEARLLNGSQRLNQNTFGARCYNNTFGSDCYNSTFGSDCSSNTFGSYCYNNTFGSGCSYNTFGPDCYNNTFGSDCDNNTFGSGCSDNTFGSYCVYNTVQGFFRAITLQNSVRSNSIDCTADLGEYSYCQNIEIKSGVEGEYIYIDDVEQSYHTEIRPDNSITITV